jgi:uncharacterized protein YaiE (UPF0345 family)
VIFSNSAFYYGIEVTAETNRISFSEGAGPELIGVLRSGKYTLTTFLNDVLRAMNDAGALTYSGSINRATRVYTITGSGTFTLKVASSSVTTTAFATMGFTGYDRTGASSYTGTGAVGFSYQPQFRLQSFVSFDDNQKAVESTLNESASGAVELVRFGVVKLMECNITFITDIDQGVGGAIETNLSGVSAARNFMQSIVKKGPIEFIPDRLLPNAFRYCVLESTPENQKGVDFKLKEQFTRGLAGYYETGLLTFREVIP